MNSYILKATLVGALVTYGLRGAVFIIFSDEEKMPLWLKKLGDLLPSAVMAILVVYCLRSAVNDLTGSGIPGIIAALISALTFKWRHNTFLSIIIATAAYMILIRMF